MRSYLSEARSFELQNIYEGMSYERQEKVLSAIAQSITGNLTVRVFIRDNVPGESGYTDNDEIYVGSDENILAAFKRPDGRMINPFLMRLKEVAHETLKSLFTPVKQYEQEIVSMALEGYSPYQVKHIFDVIENLIVDSREPSIFGGWLHAAFLYGSYSDYVCSPRLQHTPEHMQWERAISHLQNSCNLEEGMRLKGYFSGEKAGKLYEETKPLLEQIISFSYTSSDKMFLIKDVTRMVLNAFNDTAKMSDEEMSRRPIQSRRAELPGMEENVVLPDPNASEETVNKNKEDNKDGKENDEQRTKKDGENKNADRQEQNDDGEFSESEQREFESERKLNKIIKQINQYAAGLERIEKTATMSENKIRRDFGEEISHEEKHTGSLTVLPEDKEFYLNSIQGNRPLIRSLHALFKKELKRVRDENIYFTSGRIDPIRIVTHQKKSTELFRRPLGDSGANEAAITVRIDQSGSMSNRYSKRGKKLCDEAGELACVLTEVFMDLRVSLQVAGFAEVGITEEHEIFKEFISSTTPKETVAKSRLNKSSATPTGWTIYQGIHELKNRPEKNKVFILITDGYPSSRVSNMFMSTNHIRRHIRNAQKEGIAFLCLLVGECEPGLHHKIFGDSLVVANKNSSFAVAISPKLKKIAKKWNS